MQHPGELLRLRHGRLDLEEAEVVGHLLGVVDHVVERGGELVDVLAVDRGDEGLVEALDDVVRDPVAVLLADQDVASELAALREVAQHLLEQPGGAQDVAARLLEQVEEPTVARGDDAGQAHEALNVALPNVEASLFDAVGRQVADLLPHLAYGSAPVVLDPPQLDRAVVVQRRHRRRGGRRRRACRRCPG